MANTISPQYDQIGFQTALVAQAQAGDRQAFDRLALQCRPLLFAMAFLRTSHKEEAEDLVQEILTRAWQKLPTLTDTRLFLPWLKTITANACIGWHRRRRRLPLLPLEEASERSLMAEQELPLDALLAQHAQSELQQALQALPRANRLALLMHIWGDASYEEIALFTEVPASTVDGRIYRAKRQLRRLLSSAGAELLGESHPGHPFRPVRAERTSLRSKTMPSPQTMAPIDWEQPFGLIAFTRRFSLLLDSGVSLLRCFEIMETLPAPYGDAAQHLGSGIREGNIPSRVMAERPDLFPPAYIGMIHAGEVGGILEESVQRLKKVLAQEWNLAQRLLNKEEALFMLLPTGRTLPEQWEALSVYQQTLTLSLFLEAFGTLLQSGVPLARAMKTVTPLLPLALQEGWQTSCALRAAEETPLFSLLQPLGIFPEFVVEMVRFGEESGTLASLLHRLAESFEDDLEYQIISTTP